MNKTNEALAPQESVAQQAVAERDQRDPAPPSSLPLWSTCEARHENPTLNGCTALEEFIYEYDDADYYRSGWFRHRLEQVLREASQAPQALAPPTLSAVELDLGERSHVRTSFRAADDYTEGFEKGRAAGWNEYRAALHRATQPAVDLMEAAIRVERKYGADKDWTEWQDLRAAIRAYTAALAPKDSDK